MPKGGSPLFVAAPLDPSCPRDKAVLRRFASAKTGHVTSQSTGRFRRFRSDAGPRISQVRSTGLLRNPQVRPPEMIAATEWAEEAEYGLISAHPKRGRWVGPPCPPEKRKASLQNRRNRPRSPPRQGQLRSLDEFASSARVFDAFSVREPFSAPRNALSGRRGG